MGWILVSWLGKTHEGERGRSLERIVKTEAQSTLEGDFACCDRTTRALDAVWIFVWKGDGFWRVLAVSHSDTDESFETNGGSAGDGELESRGLDIDVEDGLGERDRRWHGVNYALENRGAGVTEGSRVSKVLHGSVIVGG